MGSKVSGQLLYSDDNHKFILLGADEEENEKVIQTNQYLIIRNGKGILLDPGGVHLFAKVISAVSQYISLENIQYIFFSHQDPDVSSGIALWMGVTPAKILISGLWSRFLPHFGIVDQSRIISIESKGGRLDFSGGEGNIIFIPSHFLHSTGCYSLYDMQAKILFSGDIGAAVFENEQYIFVDDFEQHKKLIDGFHKRYMNSNAVLKKWVQMVKKYKINYIASQHGAVYRGASVDKFLDYLYNLQCGTDFIDELYK